MSRKPPELCRRNQRFRRGCGKLRQVEKIKIHGTTVAVLCRQCCKRHEIPWPGSEGKTR